MCLLNNGHVKGSGGGAGNVFPLKQNVVLLCLISLLTVHPVLSLLREMFEPLFCSFGQTNK